MKIPECIPPMVRAGISAEHALSLRRSALSLHRWFELECGSDLGCVERDEETNKCWFTPQNGGHRYIVRDDEKSALESIKKIMANYPDLSHYIQGDPRGASLYILRPGDVPEGQNADSYYSRGLAVYR